MRNRTNHNHSTRNEHDITIHHDLAGPLDNLYHRLADDDRTREHDITTTIDDLTFRLDNGAIYIDLDDNPRFYNRVDYDAAINDIRAACDKHIGTDTDDQPTDLDTARADFVDALALHGFAAINGSQPAARDALRAALASDRRP